MVRSQESMLKQELPSPFQGHLWKLHLQMARSALWFLLGGWDPGYRPGSEEQLRVEQLRTADHPPWINSASEKWPQG